MEPSFDIDLIVLKYVRDTSLSLEEEVRLRQWLAESDDRQALIERIKTDPDWVQAELHRLQQIDTEAIWSKVESNIKPAPSIPLPSQTRRRRRIYAAAASLILVGGSIWLWSTRNHATTPVTPASSAVTTTDIKPGGNRAILTLADGRHIDLDTSANGLIAAQGNSQVAKVASGQLAYNKVKTSNDLRDNRPTTAIAYNTLTTPRKAQFEVRLPDGSHVWLNNASSLTYPVTFTGPDRTVDLTGEAYFEVAKDAAHPFHVRVAGGPTVDVLGTSFNIMAYSDEPTQRTTLIDGSVRVTEDNQTALLKPAQQSSLDTHGALRVTHDVNVQEVIAWKNGYFHFDHASLQTTMRQLARWYDIDVVYEGQIPDQEFVGRIQRNLLLSDVLKGLENEHCHFKLEGRRLTVTP